MEVYEKALAHEYETDLVFPKDNTLSFKTKDFIGKLLHPNKTKRLGAKYPGLAGVMRHEFFGDNFDWNSLADGTAVVPLVPPMKKVEKKEDYNSNINASPDDMTGWTVKFGAQ
jgi:hypothetical protein